MLGRRLGSYQTQDDAKASLSPNYPEKVKILTDEELTDLEAKPQEEWLATMKTVGQIVN